MGRAPHRSFGRGKGPARRGRPDGAPPVERPADPRDRACRRLAGDAAKFPAFSLAGVDTRGLSDRDAALAQAIHREAVRRWMTLEHLIQQGLDRPLDSLEARMHAVLLSGAAQLVVLDRVPAHAAIDESVEWAKRSIRPGAAGLVNAVLRRVMELVGERVETWDQASLSQIPRSDGGAIELTRAVLPENPVDRMAVVCSVPGRLIAKWSVAHGPAGAAKLAVHTLCDPPITLNVAHADGEIDQTSAHEEPGCAVFEGSRESLGALLAGRRDVWVQDASSCGAVRSVADLTPGVIVDACAGMGTKTRQLAAVFQDAEIIAADTDARRAGELRAQFEGHARVRVVEYGELIDVALGRADLVLLDVPCSNTGVLARRPEAKYRVGSEQEARLTSIQKQIVADSVRLLSDAGRILYSTCSLEGEENEQIVRWACGQHGFSSSRERRVRPEGVPGDSGRVYRDGAYSCLLER